MKTCTKCKQGKPLSEYYTQKTYIKNNIVYYPKSNCKTCHKKITNDHSTEIYLPDYVDSLATNFTVQITPVLSFYTKNLPLEPLVYYASTVEDNTFKVFGKNGSFYWHVYGKRSSLNVEPNKEDVIVHGNGPYKWYEIHE